jgi:bacterioferritin-associated ferredoxin
MVICNCFGVTERQIREAVTRGSRDLRALSRDLGVTTCCGKCASCVRSIITCDLTPSPPQLQMAS